MNNRIITLSLILLLAAVFSGCSYVNSSRAPATNVTGEVWYTKEVKFGLVWATKVFYCAKPTGKGPANCIQATIHEEGAGAPPPAWGGAPAQPGYGAPAQPGYGAPAQPGFGAPAQPGFGAPAQPGYGEPQPAAPGYQPMPPPPPPPPPSY